MNADTFPLLDVRGGARDRGKACGEAFRERIVRTFTFYMEDLFAGGPLDGAQIEARAALVADLTRRLAPAMAEEIEGIAAGSGLPAWQIYTLNARTEILNARVDECTALYFAASSVLAQNWDWVEPLEELVVIVRHEHPDGRRRIALCEPGMVAKIGMNSDGLGVCLNILFAPHALSGLPVHILIGALLDAPDLAAARRIVDGAGLGKASHLLLGDGAGHGLSVEYFGDARYLIEPRDGVLVHTNHCLGLGAAGRAPDLAHSCARYDHAAQRIADEPARDFATACDILFSSEGGEAALLRAYQPQTVLGTHRVGTCASIVMELAEKRFHVRRGPGTSDTLTTLTV